MFFLLLLVPLASGLWLLPGHNMAGYGHGHGLVMAGHGHGHSLVMAGHGHGHSLDLAKLGMAGQGHLDMAGYGRLTEASPSLYIGVSGTGVKIGCCRPCHKIYILIQGLGRDGQHD